MILNNLLFDLITYKVVGMTKDELDINNLSYFAWPLNKYVK